MRKIIYTMLSVIIVMMCGCGNKNISQNNNDSLFIEATTKSNDIMKTSDEISITEESSGENTELVAEEIEENRSENDQSMEVIQQSVISNENSTLGSDTSEDVSDSSDGLDKSSDMENLNEEQTEQVIESEPDTVPENIQDQQTFISYSPENVCNLATQKVLASGCGKITIKQAMDQRLAEGKITKEQYNSFMPYGGAGYMSFYIETNLVEASGLGGTPLHSEDAVAEYIAEQIIVAINRPYFLVECAGTIQYHGTQMYEFRYYG